MQPSAVSNPNRYEKCLREILWAKPLIRSTFADIALASRVSCSQANEHQQAIWETGCDVIGPLYTTLVWWILKKAKKDGVKRLYFMARDGLILKEIADLIILKSGLQIDTHYLYVSRQSLLYASVLDVDAFDIRWMMWNPLSALTAKKILDRLEIPVETAKEELQKAGISDAGQKLSLQQKLRFKDILKSPKLKSIILDTAQKRRESTFAYLKQEGLADKTPFALVDLGWLALSQYALSRILDINNSRPDQGVKGYYLGTNWLLWTYKNDNSESFMFNPRNMFWRMPVVQYELPEIFATANDGRTLGYEHKGDKILPVKSTPPTKALEWGSEIQKSAVLTFAQNIVEALPAETWGQEEPGDGIRKIFDLFCNWPSEKEAACYGSFIHGADMEEKDGHPIAPVITAGEVPKILTGYYWVQGSVKRSRLRLKGSLLLMFTALNMFRHIFLYVILGIFWGRENIRKSN